MPTSDNTFEKVRSSLAGHCRPSAADFEGLSAFERVVAVLLHRGLGRARWRAAVDGLAEAGLLSAEHLANAEIPEILDALRDNGIDATAASIAPLKHLARWMIGQKGADIMPEDELESGESLVSLDGLRSSLAAIKGIGPAAADAIVLFAIKRPSYPVDRASFRVLVRHGWIDITATYEEVRDFIVGWAIDNAAEPEEHAPRLLAQLSHGMAQVGRQFCRPAAARCQGCPLEHLLPEGGPRENDA
jgi:endonuclease III related protein